MRNLLLSPTCAGIGGDKCDECSVGYIQTYQAIGPDHEVHTRKIEAGETPTCTECGECFNNWQRILQGWCPQSGWRFGVSNVVSPQT